MLLEITSHYVYGLEKIELLEYRKGHYRPDVLCEILSSNAVHLSNHNQHTGTPGYLSHTPEPSGAK